MRCVVLAWNVSSCFRADGTSFGVRVVNDEIKKNGREVHVNFVLDIEEMHVKRQESVRLYPVVVAKEGGKSLELPSVVLDGRVRDKVHRREKALTGSAKTDGAYIALRRKNGEAQQVEYAVTLPYEPWMAQSRLVLREQVTGCLECAQSGMEETPVKNTFLQLFRPQYATAFVQPRKETVKVRKRGACGTFAVPSGQLQYRPEVQEQRIGTCHGKQLCRGGKDKSRFDHNRNLYYRICFSGGYGGV